LANIIDLTGQTIGRWKVLKRADNHISKNGASKVQWLCECQCEKKTLKIVNADRLNQKKSMSCGCLKSELLSTIHKKYNSYNLYTEDYGIGWTTNTNKEFYFDLEDYNRIKDYCWREDKRGYILTTINKKMKRMHRLLTTPNKNEVVDHIDHLIYDNRKSNLRICLQQNNLTNKRMQSNNTSGCVGVMWLKKRKVWEVHIHLNKKLVRLGYFDNFYKAVEIRKEAEERYYGEYRYIKENDKGE